MSTLRTDTLQNAAGTKSVPVSTVVDGSAKAWVNFNGTGTVAIRASFNVSSITDNGAGDYTVNFTTSLADANYTVAFQNPGAITGTTWTMYAAFATNFGGTTPTLKTASAVRFIHFNPYSPNAGAYDAEQCGLAIFR